MKWMIALLIGMLGFFAHDDAKVIYESVPEVELYSPEGELLSLSSLEGNIVLVHFWASWCTMCRKKNPGLVQVYDQFRNAEFKNSEGFKIFSISMDKDKENWINGIEHDGLKWDHHVSELKGFESQVFKDFELQGVPYTFLINEKGEVVGQNLFGDELSEQLVALQ